MMEVRISANMLLLSLPLIILLNTLIISSDVQANQIKTDTASEQDFEELGLHYGKYLKEVVAALDKDKKFTDTIKNMDANDIKSGKVADQLRHVHEDIRKQLNDLKNMEINRLRDLATRKNEMEQYGETYHGNDKRKWRTLGAQLSELPDHLASDRTHFDVNDLHKLMVAATNDLEKLDKERREDYKTYEMEKEWQFQERLKMMNETEKQEAIKLRQKLKEKHDDHPRIHEPGTKSQFEEVWEKKDNLPKNEFDPKTFFALHDTNSDNYWDQGELRQLLQTEISKVYDPNNPEDDPNEMEEEYERMREHVYGVIDTDKDGLISKQEFLEYSRKPEFRNDNGWEDVSKKEAYSKQEYDEYLKNREKMMHEMHGHYDPSYYANQPNNLHLPNWGFGMPAGAHPAQYYGYQIDPNHPQAQHIAAQQQMAYQQAAGFQQHPQAPYQQQAAVPQGYQQYYAQPGQQAQYQAHQGAYQGHPQAPLQHPQQGVGQPQIGQQQPQQIAQQPPQQIAQQPPQQIVPQQTQQVSQAPQVMPQMQQQQQQVQPPVQQQQQQQQQQPLQQQQPMQMQQPAQNQQQLNQAQPNQQYYQQAPQQPANQYQQKP